MAWQEGSLSGNNRICRRHLHLCRCEHTLAGEACISVGDVQQIACNSYGHYLSRTQS